MSRRKCVYVANSEAKQAIGIPGRTRLLDTELGSSVAVVAQDLNT